MAFQEDTKNVIQQKVEYLKNYKEIKKFVYCSIYVETIMLTMFFFNQLKSLKTVSLIAYLLELP